MLKNKRIIIVVLLCMLTLTVQFGVNMPVTYAATIDITTYGATPNDSTDDTTAINSAINSAVSGDTVYFPDGIWNVSDRINGKTSVKLEGQSQSGAILKWVGSTDPKGIIFISGKSNIDITKLTINGNNNTVVANGIYAEDSSSIKVTFVTVKDFALVYAGGSWGPHGVHFTKKEGTTSGVTNSEISDCTFRNIGVNSDWGTGIRVAWYSTNCKVLRNIIRDTGRGGILCNDAESLTVNKNTVTGSGLKTVGISIELGPNCNNSVVEDNILDHWLSFGNPVDGCAVRRNVVSDKSGVYNYAGIELVGTTNFVVTDNLVDDGQNYGIVESNDTTKQYMYLGYNTIKNCNQWGGFFQGDTNYGKFQYFYKTDFLNTKVNTGNPPNPGSEGTGIRWNGNMDYITFDNCSISGNGRNGIDSSGAGGVDHLTFKNCTISNNAGTAFTNYSGYTALDLNNNTVTGNGNNSMPSPISFNNQEPVAIINCPSSGNVGQSINFSSGSYDNDGTISHVLWDFNDGIPSTSSSASHTFNTAGNYRITLIVWDNYGRGKRAETTINIGSVTPTAKIDDYNGSITYSGSNWLYLNNYPPLYQSTQHYTNVTNNYAQYTFTGTAIKWIGSKHPNRGYADVYIDGIYQATVDQYNPTEMTQQVLWSTSGLSAGSHTIKIVCKGQKNPSASDYYICVDAFEYTSVLTMIDDYNGSITYSGSNWLYLNNYPPLYQSTQHYTNVTNNYAQYTFTGTTIKWIGSKHPNRGYADVYIDGIHQATVDQYNATEIVQQKLWSQTGLSPGSHTIKIVCKGQKNPSASDYYICIDAFEYGS